MTFSDTYLNSLQASSQELNEFTLLRKKLESRRLTYDAAISKADKTFKKEKDPRRSFFNLLRTFTRNDVETEKLNELCSIEGAVGAFNQFSQFHGRAEIYKG